MPLSLGRVSPAGVKHVLAAQVPSAYRNPPTLPAGRQTRKHTRGDASSHESAEGGKLLRNALSGVSGRDSIPQVSSVNTQEPR